MNSIVTAKYLSSTSKFAGRNWYYDFRVLNSTFSEDKCANMAQGLAVRYSMLSKAWNEEKNSEWICRTYLAAKMILAASLQLSSRRYARSHNLRSVDPYLAYYAILSLMRAVVFMLPEQGWDDGNIIKLSHKKILNLAMDHIAHFDSAAAVTIKDAVLKLRAARELISYWHPSSGDYSVEKDIDVETLATLLCEVAQFNSEIMERSIMKRAPEASFNFLETYINKLTSVELHGSIFFDREDYYRLDYLRRKYPAPPNIMHIMTEGHVEDFFGSWCSSDEDKNSFDPDTDWQIIFDVP